MISTVLIALAKARKFQSCFFVVFVSKQKNKDDNTPGKLSVKDIDVSACNPHDILAKLIEKGCKSDWTSFSNLYAKGRPTFHDDGLHRICL